MSGLIFLRTGDLEEIREFYIGRIGMEMWLDQGECIILKHDNFLLGFCKSLSAACPVSNYPCITFFYKTKEEVDSMYVRMKDTATSVPVTNKKFNIYHFWAQDPEGRTLEFQRFLTEDLKI